MLQPDGSVANSNSGTLEATNGGTLELYGGSWTNTEGTISAAAGSTVNLVASVSITGGTLTTTGNGVIDDAAGQYAYLTNVTNKGTYNIINNAETVISGTITNNGTINILPTGNTTALYVSAGGATLTGSGSVLMGTGATSYIYGANWRYAHHRSRNLGRGQSRQWLTRSRQQQHDQRQHQPNRKHRSSHHPARRDYHQLLYRGP